MSEKNVRQYIPPDYTEENFIYHADCRYFRGDIPCKYWCPCLNCRYYDLVDARILIVLLRRLGDILIASPLPRRIKAENPNVHITWLVNADCAPLVAMNPFVDRVLPFEWQSSLQLLSETFDAIWGFERTPSAAALVDQIQARTKGGLAFGSANNILYPIGEAAQHFFKMNTWNAFRTHLNTKTWTELYFEIAGFQYQNEDYTLQLPEYVIPHIRQNFMSDVHISGTSSIVCFNLGGSLATKTWPIDYWFHLGQTLFHQGYSILPIGGTAEAEVYQQLTNLLMTICPERLILVGTNCTLEEICGLISLTDIVITGDSLGFHIALAFNKPTVVLFGPSTPAEVVPKHKTNVIVLRTHWTCAPCARQVTCGGRGGCMTSMEPAQVFTAIQSLLADSI